MNFNFFLILVLIVFTSCSSPLSSNEEKGIFEITSFYNTTCNYSIITENNNKKIFYITLKESEEMSPFLTQPEMIASNAALLFYQNLKTERTSYQDITVNLLLKNSTEHSFTYSLEFLKTIEKKIFLLKKVIDAIKENNFLNLQALYDQRTPLLLEEKEAIKNIKLYELKFGLIKDYKIIGFRKNKTKDKLITETLHIQAGLIREKQNQFLSADMFIDTTNNSLIAFYFKL
jgi:hypothetical protein